MILCTVCNKAFIPGDPRTSFVCSSTCHGIRLTQIAKARYYANPKLCKVCDSVIIFENKKDAVTCSKSCRKIRQSQSAKIVNAGRKIWEECLQCGNKNKVKQNKSFCSRICAGLARMKGTPEERKERKRIKNLVGVRRYQIKRLNQTPILTESEERRIKEIYTNCPDGYEVDHIIPITKGGLHHPDNLQYLTWLDNRRKSNKLDWTLG